MKTAFLTPLLLCTLLFPTTSSAQVRSTRVGESRGISTSVGDSNRKPDPVGDIQRQLADLSKGQEQLREVTTTTTTRRAPAAPKDDDDEGGASANVSSAAGGAGSVVRIGPIRRTSWKDQVQEARQAFDTSDPKVVSGMLRGRHGAAAQYVALTLEREGKVRYSRAALQRVLAETGSPRVARAAVGLLSRRKADKALLQLFHEIVEHRRMGDDAALRALWRKGFPTGVNVALSRAAQARAEDETSLVAVQAIARIPGQRVTSLLQRLGQDWSSEVRRVALQALRTREEQGLESSLEQKPIVYGRSIDDLLAEAPEVEDLSAVYSPPAAATGGDEASDADGDG